ncbi:MAG: hypothetical protein HYT08_02490 [Candidatus Levybacteria bacterium]|nr:hypothetical protein [Candidatus Levybacteria bacterium]
MKEKGLVRQPPNLILASERNPGKGRNIFLTCPLLEEIQIRKIRTAISYRIVPQMFLSPDSLRIALSLIEDNISITSKIQQIKTNVDYRIKDMPIKISFARKSDQSVSVRIKAPGYYRIQSQSLNR